MAIKFFHTEWPRENKQMVCELTSNSPIHMKFEFQTRGHSIFVIVVHFFFYNFLRKYKSANSKRSLNSNQDKHSNIILRYIITILLKINDKDKTIRVAGKESACNARDLGSIPGLWKSPGEGKGYPLQYSGLDNFMDSIVLRVTKSQTRLSDFLFHIRVAKERESLCKKNRYKKNQWYCIRKNANKKTVETHL